MAKSTEGGPWWWRSPGLVHPTPPKCLWATSVPRVQLTTCMGFSQPLGGFWTVTKSKVGYFLLYLLNMWYGEFYMEIPGTLTLTFLYAYKKQNQISTL